MFRIKELRAGDFIDLENYFKHIIENINETEDIELVNTLESFYKILVDKVPADEKECSEIIQEFNNQLVELKSEHPWIYNPPKTIDQFKTQKDSAKAEMMREFAEDYGGYIELIYVICKGNLLNVSKVLEMNTKDFLFWGEYALRKRTIEQS
jgi:hypothetical protein